MSSARRGSSAATVDAIAEAAGVAKGTVYLYYASKQAIYDAVFASGMAEIERLIGERLAAAGSARESDCRLRDRARRVLPAARRTSSACMSPRSPGTSRPRPNRAVPASWRSTARRARSRR